MNKPLIISDEQIVSKIYFIRGQRVMMDRDLAEMYGVKTGNLNKAVNRNLKRFPNDFMFQITKEELKNWIFQFGTSNKVKKGLRKLPHVFTEQGVAMLSSALNSDIAIEANIQIMRIFTRMGKLLSTHKDILLKLVQMEKKLMKQDVRYNKHEQEIQTLFMAIRELINDKNVRSKPRNKIGYKRINEG